MSIAPVPAAEGNTLAWIDAIDPRVALAESDPELFAIIEKEMGQIDFIVHSIAFSNKEELKGRYVDTTLENFLNSMNISCYSFTAVMKRAAPLMKNGGSAITLTYYGAEKVMPFYNVMGVAKAALEASVRYLADDCGRRGIRVNAISAGPVRTLAASGVKDFRSILTKIEERAPLRKNITTEDVGKAALFLVSDMASGVTGEVMHVDSGYHVVGMVDVENAAETAELLGSLAPSSPGDKAA